jgi:site-specific DNA recombinase
MEALMSTALIYLRVSTEDQAASGLGLADQEQRCRAYCAMRGLDVVRVITDAGVSGATPLEARTGGADVLALTRGRRPPVRNVIALKLDRAFRSAADCLSVTADWDRRGVVLHLVEFGGASLDLSSAMGRMFLTMAAGFAELERGLTSERTRAALKVKRDRGEFTGGAPPFGFRSEAGQLVEHPEEQKALRLIAELRQSGLSFAKIALELNTRGVRHRGVAAWKKGRVYALWKRAA